MRTLLFCLFLVAASPSFAADKDKIAGTWKLASVDFEEVATKQRGKLLGEHPRGYQIATTDRWIGIVTTEKRPAPNSDPERIHAFKTLIAYSGRYRVDGSKIITKVDVASNESWVGADQELALRFDGDDTMVIETAPTPLANPEKKVVRIIITWQREKS